MLRTARQRARTAAWAVASAATQDPRLVALPVAVLLDRALVVLLLALGEPDLQFGPAVLPVELERHERIAAPLHRADQALELAAIEQELPGADRVRCHVARGGREGREVRADQERLAAAQV